VRDFEDLAGARPTVTVRAAAAKNRRERTLPLRRETAREVAGFLAGRLPQALALALPRSFKGKATCWLRFDLERAGLPYVDESGRVADMHALRASMVSGLVRAGADARTVQSLPCPSGTQVGASSVRPHDVSLKGEVRSLAVGQIHSGPPDGDKPTPGPGA
jgi:hypothetical protein